MTQLQPSQPAPAQGVWLALVSLWKKFLTRSRKLGGDFGGRSSLVAWHHCRGRRRSGMRKGRRRGGIHVPAKFDRGAQAHFAHEQDGRRRRFRRRFGRIGVKTQRRHENGIHRLGRRSERRRSIFSSLGLRRQRRGECADVHRRLCLAGWRGLRRLHMGARIIARTRGGISLQRINLAAGQAHRTALRDDHALVGKLGLDAHRAARGEHAHFAALFEAHGQVAQPRGNCDRRGDNRRRVDRESVRGFQRWVHAAIIQRHVSAPEDLITLKCAGPHTLISPPAFSRRRACPPRSVTSLPLATTVGALSLSIPDGVVVATSRSSPSIRPMTAGKSCAEIWASLIEKVATIASAATAKIFAHVAKCFLGIINENTFTCSFLKGVVRLS